MPFLTDPLSFSIVNELKGRWAPKHFRSARMDEKAWRYLLLELRTWWRNGVETELKTRFYEPLIKRGG